MPPKYHVLSLCSLKPASCPSLLTSLNIKAFLVQRGAYDPIAPKTYQPTTTVAHNQPPFPSDLHVTIPLHVHRYQPQPYSQKPSKIHKPYIKRTLRLQRYPFFSLSIYDPSDELLLSDGMESFRISLGREGGREHHHVILVPKNSTRAHFDVVVSAKIRCWKWRIEV